MKLDKVFTDIFFGTKIALKMISITKLEQQKEELRKEEERLREQEELLRKDQEKFTSERFVVKIKLRERSTNLSFLEGKLVFINR